MTTSFSLLVRGDLWNSVRANWVGTILAVVCLAYIPWGIYCAVRGRPLWFANLERLVCQFIVGFVVLMLLRWAVVIAIHFSTL